MVAANAQWEEMSGIAKPTPTKIQNAGHDHWLGGKPNGANNQKAKLADKMFRHVPAL